MKSLHITENKTAGTPNTHGVVRVFIDQDYHYGYWVPEREMFGLFDADQQAAYASSGAEARLEVSDAVGDAIAEIGSSPYKKPAPGR